MIDPRLVQMIHEKRQREVEEMRFNRRHADKTQSFRGRLLTYIGDRLIAVGNRIKTYSTAHVAASPHKSPGAA